MILVKNLSATPLREPGDWDSATLIVIALIVTIKFPIINYSQLKPTRLVISLP